MGEVRLKDLFHPSDPSCLWDRHQYGNEVTLASHFYMIAIKNPLEGVGWSLCELSHPLVDFVEIRD